MCLLVSLFTMADSPLRIGVSGVAHGHLWNLINAMNRGDFVIVGVAEENDDFRAHNNLVGRLPKEKFYASLSEMLDKEKPEVVVDYGSILHTSFRAFLGLFDEKKRSRRNLLRALALFPLAPAVAGIVQFLYPQLPLACAALSIATLIMYMMWIDDMISVDPLTKLNNRKQLAFQYEQWQKGNGPASPE